MVHHMGMSSWSHSSVEENNILVIYAILHHVETFPKGQVAHDIERVIAMAS